MEMLTGFATSAERILESAMQLTLPLLNGLGVLVIIWGVLCAAVRLVSMEVKRLRRVDYKRDSKRIRQHLGYYLILGLEFLIAVDIIETLMHPGWQELGLLAGLIVLRTLMAFSLERELKEIEESQPNELRIEGEATSHVKT